MEWDVDLEKVHHILPTISRVQIDVFATIMATTLGKNERPEVW
jgi:hypothetical protein